MKNDKKNLLGTKTESITNISDKATEWLNQKVKKWIFEQTQRKNIENELKNYDKPWSLKDGEIIGSSKRYKSSGYTTQTIVDVGYALSGYSSEVLELLSNIKIENLILADYNRLIEGLKILEKYQNKEISDKKYTVQNITVDGRKLFEIKKSLEVINLENRLQEDTKKSGHPAKIYKHILREHKFDYTTLETYTNSVDESLKLLREQLIKNYEKSKDSILLK